MASTDARSVRTDLSPCELRGLPPARLLVVLPKEPGTPESQLV